MCGMCIINGVHGPEPRSPGGKTSSNPRVSTLIPRPTFNGLERMWQRHGSNQNSYPVVLVRKPLCNQFIHYHRSSRGVFGIHITPHFMNQWWMKSLGLAEYWTFVSFEYAHIGYWTVQVQYPAHFPLFTAFRAWPSYHIYIKMLDKITHPCLLISAADKLTQYNWKKFPKVSCCFVIYIYMMHNCTSGNYRWSPWIHDISDVSNKWVWQCSDIIANFVNIASLSIASQ